MSTTFFFPTGLKPCSIEQRKEFYTKEFNIDKAEKWFTLNNRTQGLIVIDIGTETTRYRPILKKYLGKLVNISKFEDTTQLKEKLLYYIPEDIYYSIKTIQGIREHQELIFDIDPNNVDCLKCNIRKKYLPEKGRKLSFCKDCFETSCNQASDLYSLLKNHFDNVKIIFSGRSIHIHVLDDFAFELNPTERAVLAKKVDKKFGINSKITIGETDLIRLPGSLNGLVSRKVIELKPSWLYDPEKIYSERSLPNFLK